MLLFRWIGPRPAGTSACERRRCDVAAQTLFAVPRRLCTPVTAAGRTYPA